MATSITLNPEITAKGIPGLLVWARKEAPPLYTALRLKFPEVEAFERTLQLGKKPGMGDISDIFSSVGDALSSSASSIASFVTTNAQNVLSAAVPVAVAVEQAKVAGAQAQVAALNKAPLRTAYTTNALGQQVPVLAGQYMAAPSIIPGIPNTVLYIGGGLVALLLVVGLRASELQKDSIHVTH